MLPVTNLCSNLQQSLMLEMAGQVSQNLSSPKMFQKVFGKIFCQKTIQIVSDMKKMKDMVESQELRFCVLGVMPTLDIYFKIVELPQERDIV